MKFYFWISAAFITLAFSEKAAGAARNVDGIRDNSFFIEEAYNQDAGVVQHIMNVVYGYDHSTGHDQNRLDLAFTQEWPLFSQTHQISYTLLYSLEKTGGMTRNGLGDLFLNY